MKPILCAIAALALAIPGTVLAARDNDRGRGPPTTGEFRPAPPNFRFRGATHPAIRGPIFNFPGGYGYVRFGIGARLPSIFLAPTFYFDDYYTAGLYPPPPGHRWVRYGPDLLLVDLRSGEVDDVVYGVFY